MKQAATDIGFILATGLFAFFVSAAFAVVIVSLILLVVVGMPLVVVALGECLNLYELGLCE